jgi:hypothetical protein
VIKSEEEEEQWWHRIGLDRELDWGPCWCGSLLRESNRWKKMRERKERDGMRNSKIINGK